MAHHQRLKLRAGRGLILTLLAVSFAGTMGCKQTSRLQAKWNRWLHPPDPYDIIINNPDGNERAWAFRQLEEPTRNGGSAQKQDLAVLSLIKASKSEPHVIVRLAAIETMGEFKDPRIVEGLKDAYYAANDFAPEQASIVREQSLAALGRIGNPEGLDLLTNVLNAPAIDQASASQRERQLDLNERATAARALQRFRHPRAEAALRKVVKTEQDVALRNAARESLEVVTGQRISPDAPLLDKLRDTITPRDGVVLTGGREGQ